MKELHVAIGVLLAAVVAGCVAERTPLPPDGMAGKAGVFSPDGKYLSFERQDSWNRHLGVLDLASGETTWIENGPGIAGLASWGADGSLVYIFGNVTNTAYEAYVSKKGLCHDGYGIRMAKRAEAWEKRDFTSGRRMDGTPALTQDGQEVWWVSPKGLANHRLPMIQMWKAPIADAAQARCALTNHVYGIDALVNQPQFAPNGRTMAWAMLDRLRDRWGIRLARKDDPNRNVSITPPHELAYEPRWSADGKYLVYTAWQEGDAGWQCVIQEVASGVERRLCRGYEPCLSPDGKTLVYTDPDREHLRVRPMSAADYPHGDAVADYGVPDAAKPFFATNFPPMTAQASIKLDSRFDFGDKEPFAVTLRVSLAADAPKKGSLALLSARYGRLGHSLGMNIGEGCFLFDLRDACYQFAGMETAYRATRGEHALTFIRTPDRYFVSVDGSEPLQQLCRHDPLPLDGPISLELGKDLGTDDRILSCEFVRGWPERVKRPMTRKEAL